MPWQPSSPGISASQDHPSPDSPKNWHSCDAVLSSEVLAIMSEGIPMRELTEAEITAIGGGTAVEIQWSTARFDHSQYQAVHAEVRAQMAKLVKELQDSARRS